MHTYEDFLSGRVKTLGWGVIVWCHKWLEQPDRDDKGSRWEFTEEQCLFILNFYAVDENGKWIFESASLSRPKGWGKSPVLAALCCAELIGPVRFSHFDEKSGQPVGKPNQSPVIFIAAVRESQAENTMSLVRDMLSGPARQQWSLDIALSRVRTASGGFIERVTTSPRGGEGARPTFIVMDETHHWILNEAVEFANVNRRNLGKVGGRTVETTNAPVPGEGSVAEETDNAWKRIQAGESDTKLLYDSAEVFCENIYDKEEAMKALRKAYGDSYWVDFERIWNEINDPRTTEADARRFYFNQRVLRGSQWLNPVKWKERLDEDLRLQKQDPIALGFRGQTRNGACSLVATRLSDNAMFVLKTWETDAKDQEIPYVEVDDFIRGCLNFYNVKLMFAAPQNWQDIVGRWYEEHEGVVEEFWTNQKLKYAKATEEFETAVYTGRLVHDGDVKLKQHIDNCLIEELVYGHIPRKASTHSEHYISAAEAAILSFAAAQEAIQRGLNTEGPTGYVYSF